MSPVAPAPAQRHAGTSPPPTPPAAAARVHVTVPEKPRWCGRASRLSGRTGSCCWTGGLTRSGTRDAHPAGGAGRDRPGLQPVPGRLRADGRQRRGRPHGPGRPRCSSTAVADRADRGRADRRRRRPDARRRAGGRRVRRRLRRAARRRAGRRPGAAAGGRLAGDRAAPSDAIRIPAGTALDLGATAKALAVDRAAAAIAAETGAGVLVNVGGDLAAAGPVPPAGWPVRLTDDTAREDVTTPGAHRAGRPDARRRPGHVEHRGPALAPRRHRLPPRARPAHRAAGRAGLAHGHRHRGQLRRREHRQHRRDRPRPAPRRTGWPRSGCRPGWSTRPARCTGWPGWPADREDAA